MIITTLENSDRRLELSRNERENLIQLATHLHDYYDDLEFSIRKFTRDQVLAVQSVLEKNQDQSHIIISKDETILLEDVFSEAENFVSDLIYDAKIDRNEDLETICGDLFDVLFDNLRTKEEIEAFKKKMNS